MKTACIPTFLSLWICAAASAQTSTFTYQGYLTEAGTSAEGTFDFELALYNVDTGGSAIDVNAFDDVTVTGGLFELAADFTGAPFEAGGDFWVEARVRDGAATGAFTALLPRQAVNASPYAIAAQAVIAPLDVAGDANVQGALTVTGDITTFNEMRAQRVEADELFSDGPVDFQGGVAIQRFNDSVALLVENSGATQPAARVMGELEVGSLSCAGGGGCVDMQALSFPVYTSADDLIIETASASIGPTSLGLITASCATAEQILVLWDCPSGGISTLFMVGAEIRGVESAGVPMGIRCRYENHSVNLSEVGEARAMCVSTPR